MSTRYLKPVLLVVTLLGLAGCASTSEIDTLRAEIRQANETAQAAMAKADAASKQAEEATREAAAARQAADEAKALAGETDSKIDRMFKKSMYK